VKHSSLIALIGATGALAGCSDPGGGGNGIIIPDGVVFGDAGDTGSPADGIVADSISDVTTPNDGTTLPDGDTTATNPPETFVPDTSPGTCTPGDLSCGGAAVVRCNADGTTRSLDHACDEGQVCADGQCLACYPSQRRCTAAGAVESCSDQGSWSVTQDCQSEGLTCLAGTCQSPCVRDPKSNSNSGCDYWAVDMDNHVLAQNGPYAIIVSNLSEQKAKVKITRKDSAAAQPTTVVEREVESGQLSIFDLPNRNMGSAGVFWTAYRVESTAPIVAYQFNPLDNVDVFSNDASLLIPSNTFGKEYFVVSRSELLGQGVAAESTLPYRGEVDVVAAAAQTNVTIVPTCQTQAGANMPTMMPGQSYTYALEPYQVLNVKSNQVGGDLTGTLVTADKPIAVFSGHEAALSSTTCCADHLEHQMFPVSTWGTTYIASKSKVRQAESDYWRILASADGTTVSFAPAVASSRQLRRGEWFEFATTQDFVITADKPISVAQTLASSGEVVVPPAYSDCTQSGTCAVGYSCELYDPFDIFSSYSICYPPSCTVGSSTCPAGHVCTAFDNGYSACTAVGDPTLIMLPPTKQFRNDYVFLSPNKYAQDYINIIAPSDTSVTLDGIIVPPGNFTTISGSNWKVARVSVADGTHSVTANQPISVIAYGYDRDVSYGYAAGLNLVEE